MRNTVITSAVTLLVILASYGCPATQGPPQRPNTDQDCKAGGIDSSARLVAADDINKEGIHRIVLKSVSRIVITPSRAWGGGEVSVPSDLITATFSIRNVSGGRSAPFTENDSRANHRTLQFKIADLEAKVKSFSYPRRVITGENTFRIVPKKSFVQVHGTSGTVKVNGEAEARLTNRLFSRSKPATVRIIFGGTYNFANRTVVLETLEAHAFSPRPAPNSGPAADGNRAMRRGFRR